MNEKQTISFENAVSGNFRLAFRGFATALIPYPTTAAAIRNALEAIESIGIGNILVSGDDPYTIEFTAQLGGRTVPPITTDPGPLTYQSGNPPEINWAQTQAGYNEETLFTPEGV